MFAYVSVVRTVDGHTWIPCLPCWLSPTRAGAANSQEWHQVCALLTAPVPSLQSRVLSAEAASTISELACWQGSSCICLYSMVTHVALPLLLLIRVLPCCMTYPPACSVQGRRRFGRQGHAAPAAAAAGGHCQRYRAGRRRRGPPGLQHICSLPAGKWPAMEAAGGRPAAAAGHPKCCA